MSTELTQATKLPEHLIKAAGDKPMGLDTVRQFVRPPRLKIVQPQSDAELKKAFAEGSVIMQPGNVLVAEMPYDESTRRYGNTGMPFSFVPLFFYPEYFCFNPINLKQLPTIRDRSTDPKSDIAQRARNKNLWEAPCPEDPTGKEQIRFAEVLTYIIHITDVEALWGIPVSMTFQRGEHKTGTKFSGDIMLRKTDIFGNVFQANTAQRIKPPYNWFGYNIASPMSGSQWVENAEEYAFYKSLYQDLAAAHAANLLQTDFDDDETIVNAGPVVDASAPNAAF